MSNFEKQKCPDKSGKGSKKEFKFAFSVIAFLMATTSAAHAAEISQADLKYLTERANSHSWVSVSIDLGVKIGLQQLANIPNSLRKEIAARKSAVLAELGTDALQQGQFDDGAGHFSAYVSDAGIQKLLASTNAASVLPDTTEGFRTYAYDGDGRLSEVEREIDKNGFAKVEATLNLEDFSFEVAADGITHFKRSAGQSAEVAKTLGNLLASLPENGVINHGELTKSLAKLKANLVQASKGLDPKLSPVQPFTVDKAGLIGLKHSSLIRDLRLAGSRTAQSAEFSQEAFDYAKEHGSAQVIIDLRRPDGFSPRAGDLPAAAWASQKASVRKALVEVLNVVDDSAITKGSDIEGIPTAMVTLSYPALEQLRAGQDQRILRVRLASKGAQFFQPTYTLGNVVAMNLPQAWNKGYTGSGQSIAIFDTGVASAHPFLQNTNGTRKVYMEGCFALHTGTGYSDFNSYCPIQEAGGGNSYLNPHQGNAEPNCAGATRCEHGTMVAGIAAGKQNWPTPDWLGPVPPGTPVSGVAPDAQIIAVNTFSKYQGGVSSPVYSLTLALQWLYNVTSTNAITVNLSQGDGQNYQGTCGFTDFPDLLSFTELVSLMTSRGIPVVIATGNEGYTNGINAPACVSGAIKVGATVVTDDSTGGTIGMWSSSNMRAPGNDPYFVAPGCHILSSTLHTDTSYGVSSTCGTSLAAPHVAGAYAIVKSAVPSASVAQITSYLQNTGSVPLNYNGYTYRSIVLPNL